MRSISAAGLAKIATKNGVEQIIIIEVDWSEDATVAYADRDASGINGKIMAVSAIDNIIGVSNSNSSQQIEVVLDDTDGTIKGIIDTQDIHQCNARVYQWFAGMDLADRFLLFAGKLTSPITWSEADRTVTFTILSQLEDKEFGFSAEEGQFPYIPKDMVGKPWPVIFGKCLDVPALQVNKAVSGSTLCGIGILSGADLHLAVDLGAQNCSLGSSLSMAAQSASFNDSCHAAWQGVDEVEAAKYLNAANQAREQISGMIAAQLEQSQCGTNARSAKLAEVEANGLGCNPVRILGGEDFPQDTPIQLNINGGLFTGVMHDDSFTISLREHPDNDDKAQSAFDNIQSGLCETNTPPQFFNYSANVPPGRGDLGTDSITRNGFIVCVTPNTSQPSASQVAQHFWAEPGSRAVLASDEPITYIVSITPGQVLAVKAFKTLNGERKLVNVPTDLYTVSTQTYGTITAVQVTTNKPLSTIVGQEWSDDLYVTFESTIGPNTVDILEYIIATWTDLDFDPTSFTAVKALLTPFPSNFPILDRKNTIEVIQEIAFQARCAVWISNGVVYLKYLPNEPASDKTITVSDTESGTTEVSLTPTEDLVTKMVVTWQLSYAAEEPEKIILRNNVKKYGTKEREFHWYIYNQPDIILKAATFWLIRMSNTWKKIRFSGMLNLLALETFDCVTLDLPAYVANTAVKAIVEKADYDSENNSMAFECLVPVKAGTMAKDRFFWPATLAVTDTFPTPEDIASGNAGGNGIGVGATGELPIGYTDGINSGGTVFVGGPNVVFRNNSDRGDRTPTDVDFVAQTIIPATVFADLENIANPNPDLTLNYITPLPPVSNTESPAGATVIDIQTTRVIDSNNPGVSAYLVSFIRQILAGNLVLDTGAQFGDGTNTETFDFQFDDEGGQFGAGTAFLKDD